VRASHQWHRELVAVASMNSDFSIDVSPDRERVFVRPAGEIDLATAGKLEEAITELLDRGFRHVVLDIRKVTFLDSTGIRTLIACHNRALRMDARMPVLVGDSPARRPLEITGVLEYLQDDGAGAGR
jgi:anti-sigma B factor antagonist